MRTPTASQQFKETPAGRIPADWQCVRIREMGEVQAGKQLSAATANGTLRPYLRVANVLKGFIDTSDVLQMKMTDVEFERFQLRKGDVLLNEGQSIELVGRSAIYQDSPASCTFQNSLIKFRPSDRIRGEFAHQLFEYLRLSGVFAAIAARTTSIAHLGSERFAKALIPLPPVAEQERIEEILGTSDQGILCLESLIATQTKSKRGLMQLLLAGKSRYKEFGNTPWVRVRIGDLLRAEDRYATFNDDQQYRLASIRRRSGGLFAREALHGRDIKTKVLKIIRAGDFIISRMQVVHGALGAVPADFDGFFVSDSYEVLVPRDASRLDMGFFNYLSQRPEIYRLALVSSHGVHIEKMTFVLADFLNEKILIPPAVEEQRRIAAALKVCDDEIALLEKQAEMLREQKRGLMRKLLTGRVRLIP